MEVKHYRGAGFLAIAHEGRLFGNGQVNTGALALVEERGWRQSFGCARMVNGGEPAMVTDRVFGVTSFEFG